MIEIGKGVGLVVAGDVRNVFAAVDDAILNSARLCASVVEAMQGCNIPVVHSQQVLGNVTAGIAAVVNGRAEMVAAVRQMHAIKGQSDLAPVDYGCPDGWKAQLDRETEKSEHVSAP